MKICPKCGAQLPDNAGFCTTCGTGLGAAQQVSQQPQQGQYQQPQQAQYQQPQQSQYQQPQQQYQQPQQAQPQYQQQFNAMMKKPTDHTSEFDAKDISDNKVVAMLAYLAGLLGVIIALLGSHDSKYAGFHVRQSLKISVVSVLYFLAASIVLGVLSVLAFIPFVGPVLFGIISFVVIAFGLFIALIIPLICFFNVCSGKAKEPIIISNLGFLK